MPAVMVQGCTSWAGKSLLTTALCRWYADRGLHVAPFKAQNMSVNARVTPGGEIGVAQWLQAHAARATPQVAMNPVLVKPEHTGSQVVILGHADAELSAQPWTRRPPALWPAISESLDSLLQSYDLVVCEGAGSPAETNLADTDLANMRVAHHADASVLLVADIDRGGAFAHLFGTWALLPAADRSRLAGFVLNRFRGDAGLLRDGPADLAARTGMAYAGLLPMLEHRLPDEDGARDLTTLAFDGAEQTVAVVRYPTASNLDELVGLAGLARLRWASTPRDLDGADLIVLPGSKHVSADLDWLHSAGLAARLRAAASSGTRVVGICGGLQMLGVHRDDDPLGVESGGPGLGLLPVTTTYQPVKQVRTVQVRFASSMPSPWSTLSGISAAGYDIRHGTPTLVAGHSRSAEVVTEGLGFASGSVLGLACHGLLEDPGVLTALLGPGVVAEGAHGLEATFDALATAVDTHLDTTLLQRLAEDAP